MLLFTLKVSNNLNLQNFKKIFHFMMCKVHQKNAGIMFTNINVHWMINVPGTFALRGNKSDLKFKIANGLSNLSVTHNFGKLVSSHHSLKFFFPCIFVQSYMAQCPQWLKNAVFYIQGLPQSKLSSKHHFPSFSRCASDSFWGKCSALMLCKKTGIQDSVSLNDIPPK